MVQKSLISKINRTRKALEDHGYQVQKLVLFGSRARSRFRPDSDIDVCAVIKNLKKDRWAERINIQTLAHHIDTLFDVFPCTPAEYRLDRVSPLLDQIRKTGLEVA